MDYFAKTGISFANTVLVSGVPNTQAEDEIIEHLSNFGSIKMSFRVTDETNPYYKNLTIEFAHSAAISKLKPLIPYTYISRVAADTEFVVKLLSPEGATATAECAQLPDYLQELRRLAQESGQSFEEVLKGAMDQISSHLGLAAIGGGKEDEEDDDNDEEENTSDVLATATDKLSQPYPSFGPGFSYTNQPSYSSQFHPPTNPSVNWAPRISLSGQDLNPPEIQRVVVEHIVRKDDYQTQSLSPLRLRTFSGKVPKPPHEADYDSWKSQIELLSADPSLAPLHITRRIIESLLPPAADLVKSLEPNSLPGTFLHILDSAFATVEDGEELFAKFLNIFQNTGERPSSYLQRLQLTLSRVVKRGGILASHTDKHLLKQFCRGCWDNEIINKLQLEQRMVNPPSFAELLLMLRTEEDRQLAKETLMKKHIPSAKHRANIQTQNVSSCSCGHSQQSSAIEDLRKQMLKLQEQMSALLSQKSPNNANASHNQNRQKTKPATNKPKPWFCFRCGQDGHIVAHCTQEPNPGLVEEKRRQLKLKRQTWEGRTLN